MIINSGIERDEQANRAQCEQSSRQYSAAAYKLCV
jgi:hypothetical protein